MSQDLNEYMKEDALIFDNLSKEICNNSNTQEKYKSLLNECESFEDNVVLLNIIPTYYIMKTILYFKLNDYTNANIYINASLKYLIFIAKNGEALSPEEEKNFEAYKENVLDQYKILTSKKPEYVNKKPNSFPSTVKFITSTNEEFINEELNKRVTARQNGISGIVDLTK